MRASSTGRVERAEIGSVFDPSALAKALYEVEHYPFGWNAVQIDLRDAYVRLAEAVAKRYEEAVNAAG